MAISWRTCCNIDDRRVVERKRMESLGRYARPVSAPAGGVMKWLIARAVPVLEGMARSSATSFEVRWPDGAVTRCGPAAPAFRCTLHTNAAVRALFLRSDLRLGEAFLRGDVDIEGDMLAMIGMRSFLCDVSLVDHLRQTYLQPLLRGQTAQDERWIAQHYDESPEFYLTFLDRRHHCYSHGYFESADESLEDATTRKLQTALDALNLEPGARILDIGAGWGAFTGFGASRGYEVVSLTISKASEDYVQALIEREGLSAEVKRCHLLEYEDEARFDGIINLGVTEHLPDYTRTMQAYARLLKPGGRVFLDACSSRVKFPFSAFIKRHIWPGNATPLVLHEYLDAVAASPFEVLEVVDYRESYRLTTLEWARRHEAARGTIVARWGEHQFRRFQVYLWGCAQGFEAHEFGAYHVLLQKLDDRRARESRRPGWARLPYVPAGSDPGTFGV
jgi:cyclopropane-fatty-acyl-phospholipid synthase